MTRRRLALAGFAAAALWITPLLAVAAAPATEPQHPGHDAGFWTSYLLGFMYWCAIAVGSLAFLMIQYLTGGAWGVIARRIFEASARTMPLLFVLFLPILFGGGISSLYEWARPEAAHDPILQKKAAYLNVTGFTVRAFIYFGIWIGLAALLARWSAQQDRGDQPEAALRRCATLSGPGLVLLAFSVTFAAIDWLMSLEPHWYSTLYGGLVGAGQLLSALTFTIVVLVSLSSREPMASSVGKRHFHDLGKLLLAFVMLWAYLSFSQFLIIWSGNLAEEVPYYIKRLGGGWRAVALALIVAHFAIPFLVLLSRDLKRHPRRLQKIALFMLVMRFVDLEYLIRPALDSRLQIVDLIYDLAAVGGIGAIWLFIFRWQLARRPLLPMNDPCLAEAIEHGKH